MSVKPIYMDYAATTPVAREVAALMAESLTIDGNFGNPASRSHVYGWKAEQAVELARKQVAGLVGCDFREIVWTSGATESDNLAIKGVALHYAEKGRHLITSKIEHKAVLDSCAYLETLGFEVTYLTPDFSGVISVAQVEGALREDTILVTLMHVNNELGAVNDIAAIGSLLKEKDVLFHVDAAQSAGKLDIDLQSMHVDLMSFSAHKIYGPKGVGALYVSRAAGVKLVPQIHGGGHERGLRSGTLATHQLVGMGAAFALAKESREADFLHLSALSRVFLEKVLSLEGVCINGSIDNRFPGIVNIGFSEIDGETLLMGLPGVAVSSGSACTSASMTPSYVLTSIGVDASIAQASLRFSFGRYTTLEEVELVSTMVIEVVNRLR
ncbi:MAG: IscS subfamily cysteine desulfurase [Hahellaceae bacterium]|nr:IscS subfamily cysteine desulfurase [Hahellaceae bacterium]MCP5211832.1 IscS subfamily cysteine desulfurase [Hahellaceae bacterium]